MRGDTRSINFVYKKTAHITRFFYSVYLLLNFFVIRDLMRLALFFLITLVFAALSTAAYKPEMSFLASSCLFTARSFLMFLTIALYAFDLTKFRAWRRPDCRSALIAVVVIGVCIYM